MGPALRGANPSRRRGWAARLRMTNPLLYQPARELERVVINEQHQPEALRELADIKVVPMPLPEARADGVLGMVAGPRSPEVPGHPRVGDLPLQLADIERAIRPIDAGRALRALDREPWP
jgi:hypothetical protein